MDLLLTADWPGNIRELENTVKQYVMLDATDALIANLQSMRTFAIADEAGHSLKELKRNAIRDCEYKVILTSLNRNHWNRRHTAQELHISYRSLLYTMKQLGFPAKRRIATNSCSSPTGEQSQPSSAD
jgi:DNA-binding NtrC family response regulator